MNTDSSTEADVNKESVLVCQIRYLVCRAKNVLLFGKDFSKLDEGLEKVLLRKAPTVQISALTMQQDLFSYRERFFIAIQKNLRHFTSP